MRRSIRCLHLRCGWHALEAELGRRFSYDHASATGHWSFAWRRA